MTECTSRRRFWLKVAAGLLFAPVAYFGTYLTLRTPVQAPWTGRTMDGEPLKIMLRVPQYPGGAVIREFFRPAYWVDQKIRPEYWKPQWIERPPPRVLELEKNEP